jgi:hypothetical protein
MIFPTCTWRAVPEVYGPYTTVYNRYNRWSQRGLWQGIFATMVGYNEPPTVTMIDSTKAYDAEHLRRLLQVRGTPGRRRASRQIRHAQQAQRTNHVWAKQGRLRGGQSHPNHTRSGRLAARPTR